MDPYLQGLLDGASYATSKQGRHGGPPPFESMAAGIPGLCEPPPWKPVHLPLRPAPEQSAKPANPSVTDSGSDSKDARVGIEEESNQVKDDPVVQAPTERLPLSERKEEQPTH